VDRDVTAQLDVRGDVAVLVPAAGAGVRLGAGGPKALRTLDGVPLLVHAVRRAAGAAGVAAIVVAAPPADVEAVRALLAPVAAVTVLPGGATRQESVALALAAVPDHLPIVLVHDAARCLAPPHLFEAVAAAVRAGAPAVIPALPVVDTIKQVAPAPAGGGAVVVGTVDRAVLRAVQTPQGFRRDTLLAAHAAAAGEHTDDAGLVEKLGLPVVTVPGADLAMKITRPVDLVIAAALLGAAVPA
jgi:2-C-methyl-D-erythritol 4-phosphate cytidylyltransferase